MKTELAAGAFRTLGPADLVPNDFVVPYYLNDLKRRISVARVDNHLYAFDDLCTCAERRCPLSGGLLTGTAVMCQCHGSRYDITTGAVDPYLRMFGQPGLHVMDGSVMPANPGVNPSLSITALVERAISLWPNKGDEDTRPPLGSGYERIDPIMPHRPVVPAGAPGELRLDATKAEVIPAYPY